MSVLVIMSWTLMIKVVDVTCQTLEWLISHIKHVHILHPVIIVVVSIFIMHKVLIIVIIITSVRSWWLIELMMSHLLII